MKGTTLMPAPTIDAIPVAVSPTKPISRTRPERIASLCTAANRASKPFADGRRSLQLWWAAMSVPLVLGRSTPEARAMQAGLASLLGLAAFWTQLRPIEARAQAVPPLTVERIVSRAPSLFGTAPISPAWSPDGTQLGFLWNDQAMPA